MTVDLTPDELEFIQACVNFARSEGSFTFLFVAFDQERLLATIESLRQKGVIQ
jgi:hypothetical protein